MTKYGLVLLIVPVILVLVAGIASVYYPSIPVKILLGFSILYLAFTMYFIRNPHRTPPANAQAIISPADGVVIEIVDDTIKGYDQKFIRISVFMNVFNVHVNRIPYSGTIKEIRYNPGKFHVASVPKASELNEQTLVVVETEKGLYASKQIAGLIARRIVTDIAVNQHVKTGEIYGMIRFGSRLDIFVPDTANINVKNGQKTVAGETILAEWGR